MQKNIGTVSVILVTCPANRQYVINQLSSANTTNRPVTCSVTITRGATTIFIVNSATIPAGSSLICAGKSQKIVLMAGDTLRVQSNTASSIDAMISGVITDYNGAAAVPAIPVSPVATFTITPNSTAISEGGSVTYTVTTTNVPNGTVLYWENIGITAPTDFTDDLNQGQFTITGGTGSFTRTLRSSGGVDSPGEGTETIVMAVRFRPGPLGGVMAVATSVAVEDTITLDGLVINLDAGNSASYPGSGTTWTDLQGGDQNGTLVNGVGYNSAKRGQLTFNSASSQYVSTTYTNIGSSDFSMGCWFNAPAAQRCGLIGFRPSLTTTNWWQAQLYITGNVDASTVGTFLKWDEFNYNAPAVYTTRSVLLNSYGSVTDGAWRQVFITSNAAGTTIYINGVAVSTTTNGANPRPQRFSAAPFLIGVAGNFPNPPLAGYYFTGRIQGATFYNRALSATEVLDSYNARKDRFGPDVLTVNLWEVGLAGPNYIVQIDCPNNTGAPYTTLAALPAGIVLTLRGSPIGDIVVTTSGAPSLNPSLNRVLFSNVTGYAGVNRTGTQILIP